MVRFHQVIFMEHLVKLVEQQVYLFLVLQFYQPQEEAAEEVRLKAIQVLVEFQIVVMEERSELQLQMFKVPVLVMVILVIYILFLMEPQQDFILAVEVVPEVEILLM